MREWLCAMVLLAVGGPAAAQTPASPSVRCAPVSAGQVVVETRAQGALAGTLYCLGATEVSILREGMQLNIPLLDVKRIRKPADPVWDGAVKGAAVVATLWGVTCGFCDAGPYMWRAMAGYALMGMTIDALQTNRKTIYAPAGARTINWTLRF